MNIVQAARARADKRRRAREFWALVRNGGVYAFIFAMFGAGMACGAFGLLLALSVQFKGAGL